MFNRVESKTTRLFCLGLEIAGYSMLLWVDWRIAVAIFLIHWSINYDVRIR